MALSASARIKKPDDTPPSPQSYHVASSATPGSSIAFGGFGDTSDEETPREFFIRTAIDVEFGKESGQFIVRSATIERLVDWITLNHEAPKDQPLGTWNPRSYQDVHALLRCYPNVCDSTKFFKLFESRFITSGIREEKLQVLKVFQQWVEKYFIRDFINKKTNAPNALCNRLLALLLTRWEDTNLREQCNAIKLCILRTQAKLKTGSQSKEAKKEVPKDARLDVSNLEKLTADKKAARRLDDRLPEISLLELAGQMSKIEVRIFSRILEKELFDLAWKKANNRHMCRHILRMIDRSNNVSFWVATQILQDTGDFSPEKRCNRLKKFIKLAQKCLMLNNFNTLMEILGGINLRPIQRLKATWALLPEKYSTILKSMESLMENRYNYKAYREALKERKPPILPYLGVYLRDLTFIEEGNATFVEKTMINLDKMKLISQVMNDIQEYQNTHAYSSYFPKLRSKDRKFLKGGLLGLSEDALYDLSYKAEVSATSSNANLSTFGTLPLLPTTTLPTTGSGIGTPKGDRPTLANTSSESRLSSSSLSSKNNSPGSSYEEGNPLLQRVNSDKSSGGFENPFQRTNSLGSQQKRSFRAEKIDEEPKTEETAN